MSGHNKWSQIKRKKGITDAKKSREFSKLAQVITMEARRVGGDTNASTLKNVVERARVANMPLANIERAIKRATEKDAASLEEVTYEAYGPGGTAIIVECLTDNKNRTVAEVKKILADNSAVFVERGAAKWAFVKEGNEWNPTSTVSPEDDDLEKLGALVDALEEQSDVQGVFTNAS
ncbi:MAG: YebC/PmpR family DNA-binding transcriptional regulator [Parcubacteria group bacterium]|nr:YebC/PmpR family DNA-binding transcriptional regulator [Parcubacteria group bacterium]